MVNWLAEKESRPSDANFVRMFRRQRPLILEQLESRLALTWDLAADFAADFVDGLPQNNPNGVWSYLGTDDTTDSLLDCLQKASAVIIVTEHSDMIEELKSLDLAALEIEALVDGRNCLDADSIRSQGILYRGIGRRQ